MTRQLVENRMLAGLSDVQLCGHLASEPLASLQLLHLVYHPKVAFVELPAKRKERADVIGRSQHLR